MIKLENYEVVGWEHAIRGMRNPMNSHHLSDSCYCFGPACPDDATINLCKDNCPFYKTEDCENLNFAPYTVGPNDHRLMKQLAKAGSDHRKYLRYLEVYVDITAPFYWWKEFKTYRHGRKFIDDDLLFDDDILEYHIETNSCSTMHKIHEKEFTLDDFSCEHLITGFEDHDTEASIRFIDPKKEPDGEYEYDFYPKDILCHTVNMLNVCRERYLETKDKKYWWQMIQLLPSSYNQKRTVKLSYEVLINMYHSRKNHKLDEWRQFCSWIESLPYSEIITGEVKDEQV